MLSKSSIIVLIKGDWMQNTKQVSRNKYIKNIYLQIVALALAMHLVYLCIFYFLNFNILMIYNLFSVIFYAIILVVINRGYFKIAVLSVHLEVILFVGITVLMIGWDTSFALYLLAMVSLVYFWPFKNSHWAYSCAIIEVLIYIIIRVISAMHGDVVYPIQDSRVVLMLSIFNGLCCFVVMIYSAFISGVSSKAIDKLNEDLMEIADNDQLTGLRTRHFLLEQLRFKTDQCCNMAIGDIDDYKVINDTYGHLCGDYILCNLAILMKDKIPSDVIICRWGGEEFVFLSFNASKDELIEIIEKFIDLLRGYPFIYEDKVINLTMTFGVSETMSPRDLDAMIKCADDRLYEGKSRGKNQIIAEDIKNKDEEI